MQVHTQLNALPTFVRPAVTIGSFDGVHAGHLQLLNELKRQAAHTGGESVVITFEPHPRSLFAGHEEFVVLSTLTEKIKLIERAGIDHLCVVPFDLAFAAQTPEAYLEAFLSDHFHPASIVIGYDHRYGQGRQGDIELMKAHFRNSLTTIVEIDPVLIEDIAISSTRIRKALAAGDLSLVNELSSHPYLVSGEVISGDRIGRTLGFPTANISLDEPRKALPAEGIYAAHGEVDGRIYDGMAYIGKRPVLGAGLQKVVEINLFDFEGNIYSKTLHIWFLEYLRPDLNLSGLEELKVQLEKDKAASLDYFRHHMRPA